MAKSRQIPQEQHLFERPAFQYFIVFSIIATLVISAFSLAGIYQLKKYLVPRTIDTNDFFVKLNKHPELQGLQNEQPIGGQLDEASLSTLKQQFPDIYANAKIGDFLLRYKTKLVIYDYNADRIVNAVDLQ